MRDLLTTLFLFVSSLGLAGYYWDTNYQWMFFPLVIVSLISLKILLIELKDEI